MGKPSEELWDFEETIYRHRPNDAGYYFLVRYGRNNQVIRAPETGTWRAREPFDEPIASGGAWFVQYCKDSHGRVSLWPSLRRLAAQRAQALVCLGWSRQELIAAARDLLAAPVWSNLHARAAKQMRMLSGSYQGIDKTISEDLQNQPILDWISTKSVKEIRPISDESNIRGQDAFLQDAWAHWQISTYMAELRLQSPEGAIRTASQSWVRSLLRFAEVPTRQEQLSSVIANCSARLGPRALWAHLPADSAFRNAPPSRLLSEACLLSLHLDADRRAFLVAREECAAVSDQMWRDLADYLVGEAEPAALERLRDPLVAYAASVQDPLLAAGLHYVVGGNVWFPDESELSVDELAASAGLAAPPYLMDLPPLVAIR